MTAIRLEGPGPSVEYRCAALRRELADLGETEELHSHNSLTLWRELRDLGPLRAHHDRAVWRLSVAPSEGPDVVAEIGHGEAYYDWGGGLVWLALSAEGDAGAHRIRDVLRPRGGHATLIRAPLEVRAAEAVFQPQDPAMAALSARVKDGFDPRRVLNPGRMYAGL